MLTNENFEVTTLTNSDPNTILETIISISNELNENDWFLFYYTGHGDEIEDHNNDEKHGMDQVFVTYDEYLVDDRLYEVFHSRFQNKFLIMIVDACHSGSTFKIADFSVEKPVGEDIEVVSQSHNFLNETKFEIQNFNSDDCEFDQEIMIDEPVNMIYYGATRDSEVALGDYRGGYLTKELVSIYKNAKAVHNWNNYDYNRLACEIANKLDQQIFQYHLLGKRIHEYVNIIPFEHD